MVKFLGVDFVPINVPFERRLQTFSVLFYVSCFLVFPILSIVLSIVSLFTNYWWITLGYLAWFIYDNHVLKVSSRGGRPS